MSKQLKMDPRNVKRRQRYAELKIEKANRRAAVKAYYDDLVVVHGAEPKDDFGVHTGNYESQVVMEPLQVAAQTVALAEGWPNNISTANYHNELTDHEELFFPVGFFTRIKNRIKDWFNAGKRH